MSLTLNIYIFIYENFKIENRRVCSKFEFEKMQRSSSSMYNSLRRFKVPKSISPDDKGEVARD